MLRSPENYGDSRFGAWLKANQGFCLPESDGGIGESRKEIDQLVVGFDRAKKTQLEALHQRQNKKLIQELEIFFEAQLNAYPAEPQPRQYESMIEFLTNLNAKLTEFITVNQKELNSKSIEALEKIYNLNQYLIFYSQAILQKQRNIAENRFDPGLEARKQEALKKASLVLFWIRRAYSELSGDRLTKKAESFRNQILDKLEKIFSLEDFEFCGTDSPRFRMLENIFLSQLLSLSEIRQIQKPRRTQIKIVETNKPFDREEQINYLAKLTSLFRESQSEPFLAAKAKEALDLLEKIGELLRQFFHAHINSCPFPRELKQNLHEETVRAITQIRKELRALINNSSFSQRFKETAKVLCDSFMSL